MTFGQGAPKLPPGLFGSSGSASTGMMNAPFEFKQPASIGNQPDSDITERSSKAEQHLSFAQVPVNHSTHIMSGQESSGPFVFGNTVPSFGGNGFGERLGEPQSTFTNVNQETSNSFGADTASNILGKSTNGGFFNPFDTGPGQNSSISSQPSAGSTFVFQAPPLVSAGSGPGQAPKFGTVGSNQVNIGNSGAVDNGQTSYGGCIPAGLGPSWPSQAPQMFGQEGQASGTGADTAFTLGQGPSNVGRRLRRAKRRQK